MRFASTLMLIVGFALSVLSPTAGAAEQDLSLNARLLLAARNGDAAGVERAMKAGASVNARNRLGETVLVVALKRGDTPMPST